MSFQSIDDDQNRRSDLKYLTNAGGSWSATIIRTRLFTAASSNSLAVDANGKVHIVYTHNPANPNTVVFYHTTNENGTWVTEIIDAKNLPGYFSSIALDSNNKPHVSYSTADGDLKYATRQPE